MATRAAECEHWRFRNHMEVGAIYSIIGAELCANTGARKSVLECIWIGIKESWQRAAYARLASCSGFYDGGAPGEIKVWDLEPGQKLFDLKGHKGCVFTVAISPDGRLALVSIRNAYVVRVLKIDGSKVTLLPRKLPVVAQPAAVVSGDGVSYA